MLKEYKRLGSLQNHKRSKGNRHLKNGWFKNVTLMHKQANFPSSISNTSADQSSDIAASDFSVLRQKSAKVCRASEALCSFEPE